MSTKKSVTKKPKSEPKSFPEERFVAAVERIATAMEAQVKSQSDLTKKTQAILDEMMPMVRKTLGRSSDVEGLDS
jgi:hypothetical protein